MANKMRMVRGVGVNDANYNVNQKINGKNKMCGAYMAWTSMLTRCYSNKFQEKNQTYVGVIVCDEWKSFISFKSWWDANHVDGWSLDKDILSDERIYSPRTCIYVPQWINTFANDCGKNRGETMIGVTFEKRIARYRATCSNPVTKKNERLGCFTSNACAHLAWLNRKIEMAGELKVAMDEVDKRIYDRIISIIMRKSELALTSEGG